MICTRRLTQSVVPRTRRTAIHQTKNDSKRTEVAEISVSCPGKALLYLHYVNMGIKRQDYYKEEASKKVKAVICSFLLYIFITIFNINAKVQMWNKLQSCLFPIYALHIANKPSIITPTCKSNEELSTDHPLEGVTTVKIETGPRSEKRDLGKDIINLPFMNPPTVYNINNQFKIRLDVPPMLPTYVTSCYPGWKPTEIWQGSLLGRGSFGVVCSCEDSYGKIIAVKRVSAKSLKEFRRLAPLLEDEMWIQADVVGPNVICPYGYWRDNDAFFSAYEIAMNGTVDDKIFSGSTDDGMTGMAMDETSAANVVKDVALGLSGCHRNGVAHCDIKGKNILISGEGVCKIGDFGLAVRLDNIDEMTTKRTFEPSYAAPEFKSDGKYGVKVDSWSLGILLYEMLTGTRIWHNVIASGTDYIPTGGVLIDDEARDLVMKLLRKNPEDRISCEDVLGHPWLLQHCH